MTRGTVSVKTGLVTGQGCVFGGGVPTLADELTSAGYTWKAYIGGQGAPGNPATSCRHPAAGAADLTAATSTAPDDYLTRRDPFVYFSTIVATHYCAVDDVGVTQLGADLAQAHQANLNWIEPDLCSGGEPLGCPAGTPPATTGTAAADAFLATWVPKIQATPAYKKSGMIVIVSDQAPASGPGADSSACCGPIEYMNTSNPGGAATPGPGGGRTGDLVLSPLAAHGAVVRTHADHYSLLRTLEDLFKVPELGYSIGRRPFGRPVFPAETGGTG